MSDIKVGDKVFIYEFKGDSLVVMSYTVKSLWLRDDGRWLSLVNGKCEIGCSYCAKKIESILERDVLNSLDDLLQNAKEHYEVHALSKRQEIERLGLNISRALKKYSMPEV